MEKMRATIEEEARQSAGASIQREKAELRRQ